MKQEKNEKTAAPLKVVDGIRGTVPRLAGKIALREASADDLRVLLVFLERGAENLSRDAGVSPARAEAALDYWRETGILSEGEGETEAQEEKKRPLMPTAEVATMTAEETATIIKRRNLADMINDAQQICGRVFTPNETMIIAGLIEQYELEPAYVLMLISWYKKRGRVSLHYIERKAIALIQDGVETLAQLEEYISRCEIAASGIGHIRKLFGIGERALTKNEDKRFTCWLAIDKIPFEVIEIAYDLTVNQTGKASSAYADKLLKTWCEAGVADSVEKVEQFLEREKAKRAVSGKGKNPKHDPIPQTYDSGDFFARALERSYNKKD